MKTVRMGVIGLGQRGLQMLCDVVMYYGDVRVVAVCDTYADRAEAGAVVPIPDFTCGAWLTRAPEDVVPLLS